MKMSNNHAKYEVLIKHYLHSILGISATTNSSKHKSNLIYTTKAVKYLEIRSPPASLQFTGQVTEQTAVKWSILLPFWPDFQLAPTSSDL